jgi:hypothetical protein
MPATRIIIGDSIVKNFRHIKDCDVYSFSGVSLEEMTKLISSYPSLISSVSTILLHCGTNNIEKDTTETILSKFEALVHVVKSINADAKILISSILPRPLDFSTLGFRATVINSSLKRKCLNWGVYFVATHKMTLKFGKFCPEFYQDGIHLNQPGVKRVRQFFCQRLAEFGSKPLDNVGSTLYLKRWQWNGDNLQQYLTF